MRIPPYVALIPVCAGVFVAADDQTVIVTVLPQIMLDMGVLVHELDRISWTITGYLLGYVAAMPLIGRVSDVWGHRRVYAWCTALFVVGSATVAMMPSLNWLVAARIFQAVGAGALVPISIAIVGDLFPPGRRGVPLGIMGASAEAGAVIGPLWGGIIIRYLDWRWVFWMNIPLGVAVVVALLLLLKASPRHRAPIDYFGGALITASLATMTLGVARVDTPDALMVAYLVLAVVCLALFIWRQRSAIAPLLPASMFRIRTFNAANVTHILVGGALIIAMMTIPFMANTIMQRTPPRGWPAADAIDGRHSRRGHTGRHGVPANGLSHTDDLRAGAGSRWTRVHESLGFGRGRSLDDGTPGDVRRRLRAADSANRSGGHQFGRSGRPRNCRWRGDGDPHSWHDPWGWPRSRPGEPGGSRVLWPVCVSRSRCRARRSSRRSSVCRSFRMSRRVPA